MSAAASLALFALLGALAACAGTGGHGGDPIDALFRDYTGPAVPGASVIAIRDGQVVLRRAYGMADLEHHVSATPETDYRLASVTKQFTAMAVMQLARDGKLRYDQSVRDFLPELPPAAQPATLRRRPLGLRGSDPRLADGAGERP
jgi:CubicO group peptidase (beta-lactamase class C family)